MSRTYLEFWQSIHQKLSASGLSSDRDMYQCVLNCVGTSRSESIENLTMLKNETSDREVRMRYADLLQQLKSTTEGEVQSLRPSHAASQPLSLDARLALPFNEADPATWPRDGQWPDMT